RVALDEGFLAFFVACSEIPRGDAVARDREELETLETLISERRWIEAPQRLHRRPEVPEDATLERCRARSENFDWLEFASGYTPPEGMPGAVDWQSQQAKIG